MTADVRSDDWAGRAYGRPRAVPDDDLVQCGPGTLGGELLRRYWQPVALAAEATDLPKLVRIFNEDLILYRDKAGTPGLLYPRCMHRGANLLFGKVEQTGIRCCYHGWLFDEQGHCLEMPCERDPGAGLRNVRQPWYPLVEKFGILFTYMGPPDRQPVFPQFSIEENLADDEMIVSYSRESGPNGGGFDGAPPKLEAWSDYNWWQMFDNFMDAFHVMVLHTTINGYQFETSMGIRPEVEFQPTRDGVRSIQHRRLADGRLHQRVSQVILPNMNCTAGVADDDFGRSSLGWTIAVDDTHYRSFGVSRIKRFRNAPGIPSIGLMNDDWGPAHKKPMREWSLEDHQRWQTDYIAQKGQGDISLHSEEHLTRIDRGTVLMRRLFKEQAKAVAESRDPIGVTFDEPYRIEMHGGNAILDETTMECIAGFDGRTGRHVSDE